MRNRGIRIAREECIMIYALAKWLFLAVIAGAVVGAVTTFFIMSLEWAIGKVGIMPSGFRGYLLPIGLLCSTVMIQYLAPDAKGHGTEKVIEAVHENSGKIDAKVIPVKLVTTIITIATGGSAGKEGPAAQIGAGITSTLATMMKFSSFDRKKLVICGISAGFAAVFGTPIAGAIFGIEVLYIGQIFYDVLFPSFISGVVSFQVATFLGMNYGYYPINNLPSLSGGILVWVIISGIFFGLVSFMHIEIMSLFESIFKKLKTSIVIKALIGAAGLILLMTIVGNSYLGLGTDVIDIALAGGSIPLLSFFWKSLFTGITLSCGGSGGVVTPIFFIGATSGVAFASMLGLDASLFGSIGFVAVLAGCANAPISASIMAIELFGAKVAPFASIACITAFFVVGHRSVYPSQILARAKSPLILLNSEEERVDRENFIPQFEKSGLSRFLCRFYRKS